jgi:hypothetical protein
MSRSYKKPSHWWRNWWRKKPWKWTCGRDDHRRYKIYRKQLQREFRQATRLALIHEQEVPDLPPINWWAID